MAKKDNNKWIFIILLVGGIAFLSQSFDINFLGSTLQPNQYVEYRCEDVTNYKADGYAFESFDENGCEIVSKTVPVGSTVGPVTPGVTIDVSGMTLDQQCSAFFGAGFIAVDSGPSGGLTWVRCRATAKDYQGGYVQVVNTCEFADNDLLAVQSFIGPRNIDINDFQYPVKGFCKANPAILTDDVTRITNTSTVVYDTLLDGGTISIDSSKTLTLFYVLENNYQLPTYCEDSQALNPGTGECQAAFGVVFTCSEGFFDPALGICVVSPGIDAFCDPIAFGLPADVNLRLVTHTFVDSNGSLQQNYSCEYTPPINPVCPDNTYFVVDENQCVSVPETIFDCPSGATLFQPTLQQCLDSGFRWLECPGCPEGQACTSCEVPRCEDGQQCVVEPTLDNGTLVCTQGTFDPVSNKCIISGASSLVTCEVGTWDGSRCVVSETTVIIECPDEMEQVGEFCVALPGLKFYCENGNYSASEEACVINPDTKILCGDGFVYDPIQNKCVFRPANIQIGSLTISFWLVGLLLIIIGYIGYKIFSKK